MNWNCEYKSQEEGDQILIISAVNENPVNPAKGWLIAAILHPSFRP